MKIVDYILLLTAFFSLSFIMILVFTGDFYVDSSSDNINQFNSISHKSKNPYYNKDIDKVFERYYENIRLEPSSVKEELRVLDGNNIQELTLIDFTEEKYKINNDTDIFRLKNHIVVTGESLWSIARKYKIPIYSIVSINPKVSRNTIQPRQILRIPNVKGVLHYVRSGENLYTISKKYKVSINKIKKLNKIRGNFLKINQKIFIPDARPLPVFSYQKRKRFLWPVRGRLTSRYGWRLHPTEGHKHFHTGLDIAARKGTKIKAAANGVVVFSGYAGNYGKLIVLRHQNQYFTVYAHCFKILVKKGKYIKRGQIIGLVGSTGRSTGSHLHFEVKKGNKRIDPYIAFKENVRVRIRKY